MVTTPLHPLAQRPRLLAAIGVGAAVALGLSLVPNDLRWSTRALLSWDSGCLVFIVACLWLMNSDADSIRNRAAKEDEGRGMILGLATAATAASLAAIAVEMSLARADHGWGRAWRVALSVGTVGLSWFVAQLIYAMHYAHEYYGPVEGKPRSVRGGLAFPGGEAPDYLDFLHFSVVIGVASQTADIAFTSKVQRRVGTLHSTFAFVFNTVVLALTINLAAGLF
jgi:uncharacterized membrane protein